MLIIWRCWRPKRTWSRKGGTGTVDAGCRQSGLHKNSDRSCLHGTLDENKDQDSGFEGVAQCQDDLHPKKEPLVESAQRVKLGYFVQRLKICTSCWSPGKYSDTVTMTAEHHLRASGKLKSTELLWRRERLAGIKRFEPMTTLMEPVTFDAT